MFIGVAMASGKRIFLAYAREDRDQVQHLYEELKGQGFDPWLDEVDLLPGQIWKEEIPRAIAEAEVFVACLSARSVDKVGYIQNEFRRALAVFGERPPGSIFFIPVRLDDCEVPDLKIPNLEISLRDIQWVDLWQTDGVERLAMAIRRALERQEPFPDASAQEIGKGADEAADLLDPSIRSSKPKADSRPESRPHAPRDRRWSPTIVAAIIAAVAAILAATLASPWFDRLLSRGQSAQPSELDAPKITKTLSKKSGDSTSSPIGHVFRDCVHCPEMVLLPAGRFLMGSPGNEEGRENSEGPQHEVTISESFAIGRYEVTFEEYDQFLAATERDHPDDRGWGRGRQPVIKVTWRDARAYCSWLSVHTGKGYRLPSEAEWEYAARAGTTSRYAFGDRVSEKRANFKVSLGKPSEVGSFSANGWGLHDMHGNVYEWVEDHWHSNYENAPIDGSVWLTSDLSLRVLRGGSWLSSARTLRSAWRIGFDPRVRGNDTGFRCVCDQDVTDK